MTTEARRQFYLGMAGVQMWYARAPLPGAAPSPSFDFSEPQAGPAGASASANDPRAGGFPRDAATSAVSTRPSTPSTPARPSPRPARPASSPPSGRRLTDLMDAPPVPSMPQASSTSPSRPGSSPEAVRADAAPSEAAQDRTSATPGAVPATLNLGVWLGARLALVSHWTDDASGRLQTSLAGNILKSVGEAEVSFHGTFCWPVFANPKVAGDDAALKMDVLRRFLEPVGTLQVLWLGSQDDAADTWFDKALGQSPRVRFPRALAALASDPVLKRELWRVLKPLALA